MSYAQARLALGLLSIGTLVALSVVALATGFPAVHLPGPDAPLASATPGILVFISLYIVVLFPFDLLGGYLLPRWYGRPRPTFVGFAERWFQAVIVQVILWFVFAMLLLAAGRFAGMAGALGALVLIMVGLLAAQEVLSVVVGRMKPVAVDLSKPDVVLGSWGLRVPETRVVESADPSFSGTVAGLPGRERLILPQSWLRSLAPEVLAVEIARRTGVLRNRSRTRGLLAAIGWNLAGFFLAGLLPGAGVQSASGLVTLVLGFTLWSFLGLLLLSLLSRRGVLEADRYAADVGVPHELLIRGFWEMDRMQGEESCRPPLLESVLHPIPSVARRIQELPDTARSSLGAWHAATLALYLSWASLGLLARAVQWNVGRPDLWIMPPAD